MCKMSICDLVSADNTFSCPHKVTVTPLVFTICANTTYGVCTFGLVISLNAHPYMTHVCLDIAHIWWGTLAIQQNRSRALKRSPLTGPRRRCVYFNRQTRFLWRANRYEDNCMWRRGHVEDTAGEPTQRKLDPNGVCPFMCIVRNAM